MKALFAGPGAARALAGERDGLVELVLRGGAYLSFGSDWVAIAAASAPFGPLTLGVDGVGELELAPGAPVRVAGARLEAEGLSLSLERMRLRRCVRVAPACGTGAAAVCAEVLPTVTAGLVAGIEALGTGRVGQAVALLAGLGEGLTPAGDDVLAGYAAASGLPVSALAAERSPGLSLAYLRCAERGELPDAAAEFLAAIAALSVARARGAIPALCAWGATSGIALAWGIAAAVLCRERGGGSCHSQASGSEHTSSRTRRSSTSPHPTACSRWLAVMTPSSTHS